MYEPDFWSDSAESLEMSIEGNRLIAAELAEMVRHLWKRTLRFFGDLTHGIGRQQQLPPV